MRVAAWLSDHSPTQEQFDYLWQQGYEVRQLKSPEPNRWNTAHDLYAAMMRKIGRPDIVIMVLPPDVLGGMFLKLVKGNMPEVPVYQPIMNKGRDKRGYTWSGKWNRITGTRFEHHVEPIPAAR